VARLILITPGSLPAVAPASQQVKLHQPDSTPVLASATRQGANGRAYVDFDERRRRCFTNIRRVGEKHASPFVQHAGVDPSSSARCTTDTPGAHAAIASCFLKSIKRVMTTAFADAGLDGCVQSGPHYYLVGTTLAGQWCAVQTSLMRRLRSIWPQNQT
jgi:hypothetical protein